MFHLRDLCYFFQSYYMLVRYAQKIQAVLLIGKTTGNILHTFSLKKMRERKRFTFFSFLLCLKFI